MITYLKDGWYTRIGQRRLRNEVVDGAIDTASMLFRAAVPPQAITSLALKIRTLATLVDPPHRRGRGGFGGKERSALEQRLQIYTDRFPALQSFINDCLEHVSTPNELRALYLHLIHVTQMMQLLLVAKLSGAGGGLPFLGGSTDAGQAPALSVGVNDREGDPEQAATATKPATEAPKKAVRKKTGKRQVISKAAPRKSKKAPTKRKTSRK